MLDDKFSCIKDLKTKFSSMIVNEIIQKQLDLIYINPNLYKVLEERDIRKLKDFSFGDICRFASSSDEARKFIYEALKLRVLPLKKPYNLYPHQEEAISFMKKIEASSRSLDESAKGGVISLKMGMGKTLSMLSHILTAPKGAYPTLIVVSKTIVQTWLQDGIVKFFTELYGPKVCVFTRKDHKKFDTLSPIDFKGYDIVITTYSTLTSTIDPIVDELKEEMRVLGDEHSLMHGKLLYLNMRDPENIKGKEDEIVGPTSLYYTNWERIVCDEAHIFSNPSTKLYNCVMALASSKRWCLTGTPFRNDYEDIFSLLRFIGWNDVYYRNFSDFKKAGEVFISRVSKKYILSIGYKEAKIELPKSHDIVHDIKFDDPKERAYYRWLFSYMKDAVENYEYADNQVERRRLWGFILSLFTYLRQATIAPVLTSESRKITDKLEKNFRVNEAFNLLEWLPNREGTAGKKSLKIRKIVDIVKKIPVSDKFIIFSTFSSSLHIINEVFEEQLAEIGVLIVDGENSAQRDPLIESFKKDRDIRGLLTTYKIGSEGLNLTEANHAIFVDPWWTDTVHQQARARILRTGQKKETYVHQISIEGTIEQRVLEKCRQKRMKEEAALGETYQKVESGISIRLIKELLA